jgi:hypothetical protein
MKPADLKWAALPLQALCLRRRCTCVPGKHTIHRPIAKARPTSRSTAHGRSTLRRSQNVAEGRFVSQALQVTTTLSVMGPSPPASGSRARSPARRSRGGGRRARCGRRERHLGEQRAAYLRKRSDSMYWSGPGGSRRQGPRPSRMCPRTGCCYCLSSTFHCGQKSSITACISAAAWASV